MWIFQVISPTLLYSRRIKFCGANKFYLYASRVLLKPVTIGSTRGCLCSIGSKYNVNVDIARGVTAARAAGIMLVIARIRGVVNLNGTGFMDWRGFPKTMS